MFLGHYAAGVALKAADRRLSLGALFLSVQLMDVIWGALVLAGVEHVRIEPGFTASNPLDLYHYPWSHGLVSAIALALLCALAWGLARGLGVVRGPALLIGVAVFSHWPADWVVHTPDLPLWGDQHKVGLGLWNHLGFALGLEIGLFVVATALYFRATRPLAASGRWAVPAIGVLMLGAQLSQLGGPPPSPRAVAGAALGGLLLLAALGHWADRKRG